MKQAFLFAFLVCAPFFVSAQSVNTAEVGKSGSDYLRICEASTHGQFSDASIPCAAYLSGVLDGFSIYKVDSDVHLYKLPMDITLAQVEKIVVKYMNDHPTKLNVPTAGLVLWALRDAYPPQKK